jgi:hypothetical protein
VTPEKFEGFCFAVQICGLSRPNIGTDDNELNR